MSHFRLQRPGSRFGYMKLFVGICAVGVAALMIAGQASGEPKGSVPASVGVMTFAPNGTLFVADPVGGRVFAYGLQIPSTPAQPAATTVRGLDLRLAKALNVSTAELSVTDLAVHPGSRDIFVSAMSGVGQKAVPAIFKVSRTGELVRIDLAKTAHTSIALEGIVEDGATFWGQTKIRSLAVTALTFADGRLYVAGVSNAAFSSTVWNAPYPFTGKAVATKLEMYHAVHSQNETRSPIRAMTTISLAGKKHLLAAYLCTPLVTVPLDALQKSGNVKGKTIAELGWGNTPLDLVRFQAQNQEGKQDLVMITNRNRNAMLIQVTDIEKGQAGAGLTAPSGFKTAGVPSQSVPMASILHLAEQDAQFLVTVRRDLESGRLDLLSFRKAAYMRITDYTSEYDFPDYEYPKDGSQNYVKGFQDMLKNDEGAGK